MSDQLKRIEEKLDKVGDSLVDLKSGVEVLKTHREHQEKANERYDKMGGRLRYVENEIGKTKVKVGIWATFVSMLSAGLVSWWKNQQ